MNNVENLITEHIDTWTSAIKTKSSAGRGNSNKRELYGIKKLRELILEFAFRGLLVPQDANDEPADILLDRISNIKDKLIESKVIKKPKNFPKISDDEKPFELPSGWTWVRLQDIGHDLGQKKPNGDFTYIDVGAINSNIGSIETPNVLIADEAPSRARKIVKKGTVIYSTVRPYLLNIAVIDKSFSPEPIASTAFAVIHPLEGINASFVYRYLRSPSFVQYVESVQTGIAYPAINDKQFFSGLIPIAPEREQNRIADKLDELMNLCEQIEQQIDASIDAQEMLVSTLLKALTDAAICSENGVKQFPQAWKRITENFDLLFTTESSINQLKQAILQLAVMGKLVPQDINDEPATVLLKKVASQKEQLIKEGKIKKQKPLLAISDDNVPFKLPDGWVWSRFFETNTVRSNLVAALDYPNEQQVAPDIIEKNTGRLIAHRTVTEAGAKGPNNKFSQGQLLYSKIRPSLNKVVIAPYDGLCSADMYPIDTYINSSYVLYSMLSEVFLVQVRSAENRVKMPKLNLDSLGKFLVPIPPLAEQQRISEKVSELFSLCEALKSKIKQAHSVQLDIAESVTKTAIV
ncbi:TPA: restriction endonuclease subunit S [Vibrio parahaemolyticus]|uniref:restriction endonuclease subunit S n=1 Tax=Vibrio parahaemolyticus TaxID=670 RepID=UPI0011249462|nr:restriction endonuclease subunit S [Vibrio parahaemolyticus]MDF4940384.1 restriction endonuclease subunit S [Vibrio parahaemolyticus]TOK36564.1 type I restriction endonuclease subunit S [Vibrio parahaemolyticus]HCE3704270.1 restriction endonuclease subunit S [Vibrio parahaemolyticus]HCG6653111.1 restriction endonuclease subunit S [Vibrio parahaemolyticus]